MKPFVLAMLALALTAPLGACSSPSATGTASATGDLGSFDTGPVGNGLTAHIGPNLVVLYAVSPDVGATMVDYVIQVTKTKEIVYHVEAFNAPASFRLELERQILPRGVYTLKVFVDKAKTPLDEREITVP